MTGYGRVSRQFDLREITVEARAVNHRYLDITVRTPRTLVFLEDTVKSAASRVMARGKADVFITVDFGESDNISVQLNRPMLRGYLEAAREMGDEFGLPQDLTTAGALRLPDVLVIRKQPVDMEELAAQVRDVAQEAFAGLDAMRCAEGQRLGEDIARRLTRMGELVECVRLRSPVVLTEYRTKLKDKMQELLRSHTLDDNRIAAEAALFADRIAVNEETVRLRSHIGQARELMTGKGVIGKKLDFLTQEMMREANTIGSKGNDKEMAYLVIELKAEIEKMKEQVQNIE